MAGRWERVCAAGFALILAVGGACVTAKAAEGHPKPPVPPGRDPGGIGVALVGPGVDYTAPGMATRIGRDGEGEIVGFDLIDGDRRPYATAEGGTAAALIVRQSAHSRLMVFRADPTNQASILPALGMAALSPAKIIVFQGALGVTLGGDVLATLSARFKDRLVILAVGSAVAGDDADAALGNVLIAGGCQLSAPQCGWGFDQETNSDLVVPMNGSAATPLEAAAPVAALAARIWASEPGLTGDAVKARILALSQPFGDGQNHGGRGGWIADPAAHLAGQ